MELIEILLDYCKNSKFSKEFSITEKYIDDGYKDKDWIIKIQNLVT